jgi:molybdate transport system substrate-binding protein
VTSTFFATAIMVAIGSAFWSVMPNAGVAHAVEVKLLSPPVMKPMLSELAHELERMTGHTLTITYAPAGAVKRRIETGEPADALILQKPVIDAFAQEGRLAAATIVPLARSGVAVAVRKGVPKPDISAVEACTRALLAAKSVAYFDPTLGHASGMHVRGVLERLGIAQAVHTKATLFKTAADFEAEREAEIAIAQPTNILATPHYELVGWLPEELQDRERFTWAMGVTAHAKDPHAAKALIQFLSSPAVAAAIKQRGMEPAVLCQKGLPLRHERFAERRDRNRLYR